MDAITKKSKEWRDALQFAGKWKPGACERCHVLDFNRTETLPSGNVAVHHIEHDISPPDISPDLLYAILEAGSALIGEEFVLRVFHRMNHYSVPMGGHPLADAIIRAAASLQEAK